MHSSATGPCMATVRYVILRLCICVYTALVHVYTLLYVRKCRNGERDNTYKKKNRSSAHFMNVKIVEN